MSELEYTDMDTNCESSVVELSNSQLVIMVLTACFLFIEVIISFAHLLLHFSETGRKCTFPFGAPHRTSGSNSPAQQFETANDDF